MRFVWEYHFNFAPYIAQGGTLTFTRIASDLPPALQPYFGTVSVTDSRLSMKSISPAPPGEGYIISSSYPGTKIARVRLKTNATSLIVNNVNWQNEMNLQWRVEPELLRVKIMANIGDSLTDITNQGNVYVTPNFYGMFIGKRFHGIAYSAKLLEYEKQQQKVFYNTSTGKLNLKDTVTIEIHYITYPYELVSSFKSRLDSISLSTFSVQAVPFYFFAPNLFYIAVKHRNSIETWSTVFGNFSRGGSINYFDMTNSVSSAFGNNLKLVGTKYCLYSGDVNQDKVIDTSGFDFSIFRFEKFCNRLC